MFYVFHFCLDKTFLLFQLKKQKTYNTSAKNIWKSSLDILNNFRTGISKDIMLKLDQLLKETSVSEVSEQRNLNLFYSMQFKEKNRVSLSWLNLQLLPQDLSDLQVSKTLLKGNSFFHIKI